jgi:hypothetical protein
MPIIWGLDNPKIGEREGVAALLKRDHHLVSTGQVILADKGFAGREFEPVVHHELGAHLLGPDRTDETARQGTLARYRRWIEAIIDTLKGQLTLEAHGRRTLAGVYSRVATRHSRSPRPSRTTDAPTHARVIRSLTACDH